MPMYSHAIIACTKVGKSQYSSILLLVKDYSLANDNHHILYKVQIN